MSSQISRKINVLRFNGRRCVFPGRRAGRGNLDSCDQYIPFATEVRPTRSTDRARRLRGTARSRTWRLAVIQALAALHCRGRCRRILSRCSVRRRGKTSSPRRLCDPRSSVSCAAVGLRARFTLSADHAASSRTSQNAPACAAARPQSSCTDHRQSVLHQPPTVRLALTTDSAPSTDHHRPPSTDHRQSA